MGFAARQRHREQVHGMHPKHVVQDACHDEADRRRPVDPRGVVQPRLPSVPSTNASKLSAQTDNADGRKPIVCRSFELRHDDVGRRLQDGTDQVRELLAADGGRPRPLVQPVVGFVAVVDSWLGGQPGNQVPVHDCHLPTSDDDYALDKM